MLYKLKIGRDLRVEFPADIQLVLLLVVGVKGWVNGLVPVSLKTLRSKGRRSISVMLLRIYGRKAEHFFGNLSKRTYRIISSQFQKLINFYALFIT